jgi:cytochrome P450
VLKIPPDHPMPDDTARLRAMLEAGRLDAPVQVVTIHLPEMRSFVVGGRETFFPEGTEVSLCLQLACLDPAVFPDPERFDASRPDLVEAVLLFNAVGYNPDSDGFRRSCPGRNIVARLCSTFLEVWRG